MTPPRVLRHRRTGLRAALAAVLLLVGLIGLVGPVRVESRDDAWLLSMAGQTIDLRGHLEVAWQNARRDCSPMRRDPRVAQASDGGPVSSSAVTSQHEGPSAMPRADAALQALQAFSPPDSLSARLVQADAWQPEGAALPSWWVLQAQFDTLEPVVVLVRVNDQGVSQVVTQGVWSSTTRPWNRDWRIRRFMAQRVADVPSGLLACLDASELFDQPPRPLQPSKS